MSKSTDETRLRQLGFMTKEEFMQKITNSIDGYLSTVWPSEEGDLHHPEDLLANTAAYIDALCVAVQHFGVGSTTPLD